MVTEWVEVARRGENHHVLYFDLMTQTMKSNKVGETFSAGFVFIPTGFRQFAGARWFSKQDVEKYTDLMREACEKGKVLGMGLAWEQDVLKTRAFASTVAGKSFSHASNQDLAEVFKQFCSHAINHWGHAYHYMMLNRFLPDEVSAEIAKKVPDVEKQRECMRILFTSDKPTEIREENIAFVNLALYLLRNRISPESTEAEHWIKEHLKKYAHLGRYYLRSKPYSHQDVINRLSHLTHEEAERKRQEFVEQEKIPEKSKVLVIELQLSRHVIENIYAIKQFAFAANYADESYSYLADCISPFMFEIGNRLDLTWDELCSMRSSEIEAALEKGEKVSEQVKAELHERFADHALVLENGEVTLLFGSALKKYYAEQEKKVEDVSKISSLKGLAASPGHASGKVTVILSSKDLAKVSKGDIIVATMTTPEFVPAMEKASAIVTDEGGILCHAAIVSRELHLPCVIGTRIATKVLKDGMKVEVDARQGTVKIVS